MRCCYRSGAFSLTNNYASDARMWDSQNYLQRGLAGWLSDCGEQGLLAFLVAA